MKSLLTALLFFFILTAHAQLPTADAIKVADGEVTIQPVFHGALVLGYNGTTIYVDPYNGAASYQNIKQPDLVLITDIHGDHHDKNTLAVLDLTKAILVVPQAVADQLSPELKPKAVVVNNGSSTEQKGISISAIPMYNLPDDSTARHTKGRGNGYVITMGGKKFYVSGDTEDIPEMRSLRDIDVAFVCMNIPYTMTVEQAADAVLAFKPKVVYPYHYRGQGGLNDIEKFKSLVNTGDAAIDVRLRNWYADAK